MPTTYTAISSTTLAANATSVALSSIPQTFTDLLVRWSVRVVSANPINGYNLRLNSDAAALYSSRYIANGGGVDFNYDSASNAFSSVTATGGSAAANTFGSFELYIPNYTGTASKALSYFEAVENDSSTAHYLKVASGLYRNTTGITSINFTNATFAAGSTFHVYGIKKS